MDWRSKLSGFYAIADRDDEDLMTALVDPTIAGASVLQLRLKARRTSSHDWYQAAERAREVTRRFHALFIVDDRVDVALAVGADGVHLGQTDLPLSDARALVQHARGASFVIGVSTHNASQVVQAVAQGADYLGYGPVFATSTKHNPDPVQGLTALAQGVRLAKDCPVVAIGGVSPENVSGIYQAGAAAACAIESVNRADDIGKAGQAIQRWWH